MSDADRVLAAMSQHLTWPDAFAIAVGVIGFVVAIYITGRYM